MQFLKLRKHILIHITSWLSFCMMSMFTACTPEPEPIDFGNDICVHCKMIISDTRFGGEAVTQKSKVHKFDSVECLVAWYLTHKTKHNELHSLWVVDFSHPKKLHSANKAIYLYSENLASPMGLNLSAFSTGLDAEKIRQRYSGSLLDWDDIQKMVENQWLKDKDLL